MQFRTGFQTPSFRNLVLRTLSQSILYYFQTFQLLLFFIWGFAVYFICEHVCETEEKTSVFVWRLFS